MGKLTFKGDAPVKKKKKTKAVKHDDTLDETVDGWLPIPLPSLALGPLYLTLPATPVSPALCLALQPTTGKVYPFVLPSASSSATSLTATTSLALGLDQDDLDAIVDPSSEDPAAAGPTDVHHVWVCTRIPDSDDKVTFRSATNRFLASDDVGVVSADREARGVQEEWTLDPVEGRTGVVRIRNSYGKLLSVDTVAGGKLELRADEEGDGGETEAWKVWMQGAFLGKAKKALQERMGIKTVQAGPQDSGLTIVGSLAGAEIDSIKKYQARGQGRLVGTEEDVRDLKRARKDGKLGEAMLERRVKLKSDRYC